VAINIFLKNIYYIETGKDHCCLIHTTSGVVRTASPMSELEQQLQGEAAFLRCYRSYIVNLNMIQTIEDNQLIMKNGDPVMITLRNKAKIKKEIADYFWSQTRE
jgi:DNA-binding LytR/AlgR family response regulator